ncbi:ATP-binding protein [Oligoflexia bacterium]|nr:ATP-binding protein [Oligoflexia bacterium]
MLISLDMAQIDIIPRIIGPTLKDAFTRYPILTLTGPRQSGKTTLVRELFPDKPYVNLETTRDRQFAEEDPVAFLNQFPSGAVLDEIQRVPALLSDIQVIADEKRKNGLFVLTGSQNLLLSQAVSQSLAGRTVVHKLLPLSIEEVQKSSHADSYQDLNAQMLYGFYPRIIQEQLPAAEAYGSYTETYLERDVRDLSNIQDLSLFRKFLSICAGNIGQLLNKDSISGDVGISSSTVERWISVLEATYIAFRLQPWNKKIRKRLIKMPKLYFYDVGLASYLLGIEEVSHLKSHPLRGALFENLQVVEAVKYRWNLGKKENLVFFRDSHGNEVDMVLQISDKFLPIEVKASETYSSEFTKGLKKFGDIVGDFPWIPYVVMGGADEQRRSDVVILPWNKLNKELHALFK